MAQNRIYPLSEEILRTDGRLYVGNCSPKIFFILNILLLSRWNRGMTFCQRYMSYLCHTGQLSYDTSRAVFFAWKKIGNFFISLFLKSFENFWQNEPCRIIIAWKLVPVVWLEVCKEISENFIPEQFKLKKVTNEIFRNFFADFKSNHRNEFLCYDNPTGLILSEIFQTFQK